MLLVGVVLLFAGAAGVLYGYVTLKSEIPEINQVGDYRPLGVTQIISLDGEESHVMAEFYKERRYLAAYEQIPTRVVQAFLSAEDSTFFEHGGINFAAIARAAMANFLAGHVVQGGSTITQQIAKSLYLSPERNLVRKIKELIVAIQLERNLTKEEILYLYLNQIYLGSGAYGVEAAARTYFQKSLGELTVAESALIAGLPTAPGKYSPLLNPKKAKERQLYVLSRMKENGYIGADEKIQAEQERIKIYVNDGTEKHLAPHLVEHIRRHLIQKYGEKALYEEALTVIVPSALRNYRFATQALQNGLEGYDQRKGYRGPLKKVPEPDWAITEEELRKEITAEYFPFRYLVEEGSLDLEGAILDYDPTYQKSITGKKVKALVTQVSQDEKYAVATIGLTQVTISLQDLRWAHPFDQPRREIKKVSDVLTPGDLIWVKLSERVDSGWKAKLSQIPEIEGALYSVDIQSGQILAMVGGYDFNQSQFNRAVQAKRQMGSTFKPVIYSAAIERGYTPATIIVDSPIVFEDAENGTWKPENYEEKFYGDTIFRQALINSRNIPTVKIVQDVRVESVIHQAKRLGLEGPFNRDLSISLGSATTSVQDLVHAFTAFPMGGKSFRAVLFDKIMDRDGRVLETSKDLPIESGNVEPGEGVTPSEFAPVIPGLRLDPRVAYVMSHLMKEVVQFGTAAKAKVIDRTLAGKTGTTQDFRDSWFIGFSPQVVTGVWVGFDEQKSMGWGETGSKLALPIWIDFMKEALSSYPNVDFDVPPGVSFVKIDPKTGKRSEKESAITEAFIAGTEPGVRIRESIIEDQAAQGPGTDESELPNSIEHVDDETLREVY